MKKSEKYICLKHFFDNSHFNLYTRPITNTSHIDLMLKIQYEVKLLVPLYFASKKNSRISPSKEPKEYGFKVSKVRAQKIYKFQLGKKKKNLPN